MEPLLSLRSVNKTYWRGDRCVPVLEDVSLDVRAGEFVTVWGKHNSGKTTLLKLSAGLEQPTGGKVLLAGRDLSAVSAAEHAGLLRGRVAWGRPNGPDSAELKVIDYVALPLLRRHGHREARRRAVAALDRVGVSGVRADPWRNLSDSERALVSIAHAFVRDPELLLIDEQTSNLDFVQRDDVMGLLRAAADCGMAVLAAVPDMASMVHAHAGYSLSGGRLLAPVDPLEGDGNVIDFPGGALTRDRGVGGASA